MSHGSGHRLTAPARSRHGDAQPEDLQTDDFDYYMMLDCPLGDFGAHRDGYLQCEEFEIWLPLFGARERHHLIV